MIATIETKKVITVEIEHAELVELQNGREFRRRASPQSDDVEDNFEVIFYCSDSRDDVKGR